MRKAGTLAREAGIRFADAAIVGAISIKGAKTALLCAGDGTLALSRWIAVMGAPVKILEDGSPGDAAMLKLLRSIFMKGLEALTVETLVLAEKQNLRSALYEKLADVDQVPIKELMEMLLRTHVMHARRRLHEVEDAEAQLREAGLEARVTPGVKAQFNRTCAALADSQPQELVTLEQTLDWLVKVTQSDDKKSSGLVVGASILSLSLALGLFTSHSWGEKDDRWVQNPKAHPQGGPATDGEVSALTRRECQ
jgi:hypothetical protein